MQLLRCCLVFQKESDDARNLAQEVLHLRIGREELAFVFIRSIFLAGARAIFNQAIDLDRILHVVNEGTNRA